MKLKIDEKVDPPGYVGKSSYAWRCKLCTFLIYPNLSRDFVIDVAMSHLRTQHNVTANITIELKED